jgi:hypothetical protein
MILARVASLMPGRACSARSTVPIETPTVSAISLIPADFASVDPPLERMDLRACPLGSLRLSFEDFTGDIVWPFLGSFRTTDSLRNRIKFTAEMRRQLDCQYGTGI